MKIELKEIKDKGFNEERVILSVNEDCNVMHCIIVTTRKTTETSISADIKNPFWFTSKLVKKGDLVVLYTQKGTNGFKTNEDNTTSHFFYRNLENPILSNPSELTLVVEVNTWKTEGY
jgi:hypothetical protein